MDVTLGLVWLFGRRKKERAEFAALATERVRRFYPLASVRVEGSRLVAKGLPDTIDPAFDETFEEWRRADTHREEVMDLFEDAIALAIGISGDGSLTEDERNLLSGSKDSLGRALQALAEHDPDAMQELAEMADRALKGEDSSA